MQAIPDFVRQIFDTTGFPKRWNCGRWSDVHGWTHIISDLLIGSAYFAIPAVLAWFMLRRRDVPFGALFWSFALFILSCGVGHLIEASIFWHPWYRLAGSVKVITAVVSWATVFSLVAVLPRALALPRLAGLSERLMAEVAERTRIEQLYRNLYENSPAHYLTIDPRSGRILLCNKSFADVLGFRREELIGRRVEEFVRGESVELLRLSLGELERGLNVDDVEIAFRDGDRPPITVLFSGTLLKGTDSSGGSSAACALRNITERKQAELALRDSEQRFQSVIEHAPSAILLSDERGRVVLGNRKASEYFGYDHDELIGLPIENLVPERYRQSHGSHRAAFYADPQPRTMSRRDVTALRKDGSEFPVEVGLNPIWMNGRRHVVAAILDVTERRTFVEQLEKTACELQQMNHDLEQIAYAASHDLQEPLRAVAGYCQLLKLEHSDGLDAEARDYVDKAVSGTKRMHALIQGLLAFSRVQRVGTAFEPVAGNDVVTEALENLETAIAESGAAIEVGELPVVSGDRQQLVQLFQNLVGNAIKYCPDRRPEIRISASRSGKEWRFAVQDNGIGIAPEFREKIFLIFHRLHSRGDYDGTGIGLALCKQIVERHQGVIWVEGEEGQGSTFLLTLPDVPSRVRWRTVDEG